MAGALFLTGNPGTGKTTLIRSALAFFGGKAGGFYTSEIRENNIRLGFKLITVDGAEAILSHISFHGSSRVGKYGVDINTLDGSRPVLGTIMMKPHPFADGIKKRRDVRLVTVTRQNRDAVLSEIKTWIRIQLYENNAAGPR
jgi:nucleoside-triphosphatase